MVIRRQTAQNQKGRFIIEKHIFDCLLPSLPVTEVFIGIQGVHSSGGGAKLSKKLTSMHFVRNSDSAERQALKFAVKAEIVIPISALESDSCDSFEAETVLRGSISIISEAAIDAGLSGDEVCFMAKGGGKHVLKFRLAKLFSHLRSMLS